MMFGLGNIAKYEEKTNKLSRKVEELEYELENKENDLDYQRKENRVLTKKLDVIEEENDEKVTKLKARIEVLEDLQNKSVEMQKKDIEQDTRAAILGAQADSLEQTRAELDKRKDTLETEIQKFKESFYADGLADGLRKAHEITAEDRKQMAQIAALAAASHTPAAAEQIASAVSQNLLPSGNTTKAKKNG